jgi:hypothetical protein
MSTGGRFSNRRSGFQDFLDGFNGAFETGSRIGRQIETASVMKEKPEEVPLSDEEYAAQAAAGPVAPNTQYNGKTYQRPIGERELTGLRTNRLADVAAKYGDAEGSLRLRKQAGDMEWENESRDRQRVGYGREDEAYNTKQKGLRILSEIDPNKPESFIDASNRLMANGQAPEAAAARSQATETKAWQTARQNEGFDTADQAIRAGAPFMEKFNAVGSVKLDAEPTVTRTKDKTGREVISVVGTIDDGKPFEVADWDAYVTGRLPLEKRQAVAASLRDETRKVDESAENTRRWNEGHKLDVRRTSAQEAAAKAAREAASEARQARIDLQKVEQGRKDRDELSGAAKELDTYAMNNPIVMERDADGKEVVNQTTQKELREFLNAHPSEGVNLIKLFRTDPRAAKSMADRLTDQFLLHKAAEAQTGKKLPYYANVEYGKQRPDDYSAFDDKKVGLGAGLMNRITGGEVVRYGDVTLDFSKLVDGPNGERIKRLLTGRQEATPTLARRPDAQESSAMGYLGGSAQPAPNAPRQRLGDVDVTSQLEEIGRARRARELSERYAADPKSLTASELTELMQMSQRPASRVGGR